MCVEGNRKGVCAVYCRMGQLQVPSAGNYIHLHTCPRVINLPMVDILQAVLHRTCLNVFLLYCLAFHVLKVFHKAVDSLLSVAEGSIAGVANQMDMLHSAGRVLTPFH